MERKHYLRIKHNNQEAIIRFEDWITGTVIDSFKAVLSDCMKAGNEPLGGDEFMCCAVEAASKWTETHPGNEASVVTLFDAEIEV